MDNMAAGWDRPQEDEFALCMLGPAVAVPDDRLPQPPAARRRRPRPGGPAAAARARSGSGRFSGSCRRSASATRGGWCSSRRRTPAASRRCWSCSPTPGSSTSSATRTSSSRPRSTCGSRSTGRRRCRCRLPRAGGARLRAVQPLPPPAGGDPRTGRPGPVPRAAVRGVDQRPGRRDAPAVRAARPRRLRDRPATPGALPGRDVAVRAEQVAAFRRPTGPGSTGTGGR